MSDIGNGNTVYDIVKKDIEERNEKLTEEGRILRQGSGRYLI